MRLNLATDLLIRALGLIRIFLTPLILTLSEYGRVGLLSALLVYASFADWGLLRHFEISSSMRAETLREEVSHLLAPLLLRLALSSLLLAAFIFWSTESVWLSFLGAVYVFTFNFDVWTQIILRHQRRFRRLAFAAGAQAVLVTALVAPLALYGRVPGVIALQALAPLLSVAISLLALRHSPRPNPDQPSVFRGDPVLSFWLLLGQVQMVAWVTLDRLCLSRWLPAADLGLWNLGSMASSVLLGVGSTWGMLKIVHWREHPHEKLGWQPWALLTGLALIGAIGMKILTHWILHQYEAGLPWNLAWLATNILIAGLFIVDARERARITNPRQARRWFLTKAMGLLVAGFCIALLDGWGADPRGAVIAGTLVSSAFVLGIIQVFGLKFSPQINP